MKQGWCVIKVKDQNRYVHKADAVLSTSVLCIQLLLLLPSLAAGKKHFSGYVCTALGTTAKDR